MGGDAAMMPALVAWASSNSVISTELYSGAAARRMSAVKLRASATAKRRVRLGLA